MADPLTRADVQRIAELASLELTDAEVDTFARQLADILAYAQQVQTIDTAGIPSHLACLRLPRRSTGRTSRAPRSRVTRFLLSAPDPAMGAGLFRVPRVIG